MAATYNRPDPYSAQSQSPLFTLPRELRDEIYEHYSLEEGGYFHDIATGKLSLANQEPIDLRLMYTCKAVAKEMKDVALRTNTVTFIAGDVRDSRGFHGFHSRAGRFGKVIKGVIRTRRRMLHYVAECITPERFESTITKFGDGGRRLVGKFRAAGDWPRSPRYGDGQGLTDGWHVNSSVDESTEHHDALLYLLKRASTDERFEMLVRGAFDVVPDTYLTWAPSTKRAALSYALNWQSLPWEMPTEAQLTALDSAFYTVKDGAVGDERGGGNLPNTYKYLARFKWFFSAAAVSIFTFNNTRTNAVSYAELYCRNFGCLSLIQKPTCLGF